MDPTWNELQIVHRDYLDTYTYGDKYTPNIDTFSASEYSTKNSSQKIQD